MGMPIGRYIAWVGATLLALLFAADRYLPKSLPEPTVNAIDRPVIRIASVQKPPERVVIDTNQPTIVPPPTLVGPTIASEPSPLLQSYAAPAPPPPVVVADKKRRTVVKRQAPKVAANQPPSTPAVASAAPATIAPPTKLSLADIISGQLVRNLFNLH